MANKFTKSVLERQAKERRAQSAATQPPASAAEPVAAPPAPESVDAPQTASVQPIEPPLQPPAAQSADAAPLAAPVHRTSRAKKPVVPNLDAYIVRDEGRSAKNKTFYLDIAVIEAIRAAAASQKVTDSKLVNDILRKILGV